MLTLRFAVVFSSSVPFRLPRKAKAETVTVQRQFWSNVNHLATQKKLCFIKLAEEYCVTVLVLLILKLVRVFLKVAHGSVLGQNLMGQQGYALCDKKVHSKLELFKFLF